MKKTILTIISLVVISGTIVWSQNTEDINSKLEKLQISVEAINIKINNMQHELQQLQKDIASLKQQKVAGKTPVSVSDQKVIKTTVNDLNPRLARLTKLYGKDKATRIINKQLFAGMSHGMVMESLGRPLDTKKTTSSTGLREEWIYDNKILIFVNGELKEWKDK